MPPGQPDDLWMRTHELTALDGTTVVLLEPECDADAAAIEADERVDRAVMFADHGWDGSSSKD